jgi:hypothetical protein
MYFTLVGVWTFDSFWGVFGHMKVFMPAWTYWFLGVISLAAVVASVRGMLKLKSRDILLVYWALIIMVLVVFVKFNLIFFQAQGRYLYPALIPIAVFWSLGMRGLLPESRRGLAPYLAVGIPAVVQVIALATCIIPQMPYYL